MSTDTKILTDEQIRNICDEQLVIYHYSISHSMRIVRAVEQAVLSSPEVVAMRRQAEMTTETLHPDNAAVHMYPSDLERFKFGEHTATAFSIAVGCPGETSVPLFTTAQAQAYADARVREVSPTDKTLAIYDEGVRDGLEAAAAIADRKSHIGVLRSLDATYKADAAKEIAAAIRALIK